LLPLLLMLSLGRPLGMEGSQLGCANSQEPMKELLRTLLS